MHSSLWQKLFVEDVGQGCCFDVAVASLCLGNIPTSDVLSVRAGTKSLISHKCTNGPHLRTFLSAGRSFVDYFVLFCSANVVPWYLNLTRPCMVCMYAQAFYFVCGYF